MDDLPAAETHADMGDVSLAVVFCEEEQVAHLVGWLDRFGSITLHIGITGDINANPTMEQPCKAGTINAVAARTTPKIGDANHALGILSDGCPFFCQGYW